MSEDAFNCPYTNLGHQVQMVFGEYSSKKFNVGLTSKMFFTSFHSSSVKFSSFQDIKQWLFDYFQFYWFFYLVSILYSNSCFLSATKSSAFNI